MPGWGDAPTKVFSTSRMHFSIAWRSTSQMKPTMAFSCRANDWASALPRLFTPTIPMTTLSVCCLPPDRIVNGETPQATPAAVVFTKSLLSICLLLDEPEL